jgi:hypothetical protein
MRAKKLQSKRGSRKNSIRKSQSRVTRKRRHSIKTARKRRRAKRLRGGMDNQATTKKKNKATYARAVAMPLIPNASPDNQLYYGVYVDKNDRVVTSPDGTPHIMEDMSGSDKNKFRLAHIRGPPDT